MSHQIHHLHQNKLDKDHNILLLLIPLIVFVLVVALIAGGLNRGKAASKPGATNISEEGTNP